MSNDEEKLLPYATIAAATAGDARAIASVLEHYRGYITHLSRRLFFDEYGACYVFPDDTMAKQLENKLIAGILKFSAV